MDSKAVNDFVMETVNPKLREHSGWIELLDIDGDTVSIRFRGACSGCAGIQKTLDEIVKPALCGRFPEIREVLVNDDVPEELYTFAKSLFTNR